MKKLILVFGIGVLANTAMMAQIPESIPSTPSAPTAPTGSNRPYHMAVGYHVNSFNNDFGFGIGATSPYFIFNTLAIRGSYNFQKFNYIDTSKFYTTATYKNIKFGLLSSAFIANKSIRLYGEGGVAVLVCPAAITATNTSYGGYGLFGFEFFITRGFSYFIELGAIGTKTRAENVPSIPIFSNGFTASGGLRLYFKGKG